MAQSWGLHTLRGNIFLGIVIVGTSFPVQCFYGRRGLIEFFALGENAAAITLNETTLANIGSLASQRSLHNAPIFRLLLKVAVNGTHQCDFQNF